MNEDKIPSHGIIFADCLQYMPAIKSWYTYPPEISFKTAENVGIPDWGSSAAPKVEKISKNSAKTITQRILF